MGKLLVDKKKLDAMKKNAKSKQQQEVLSKKIDKKQADAKKLLAKLKTLKEKR